MGYLPGLKTWVVFIPTVMAGGALLGGIWPILFGALSFIVARLALRIRDFGVLWSLLTNACALAIAISTMSGEFAYISLRGDRVVAVVAADAAQPFAYRLVDPATNEDLGVHRTAGRSLRVGDTVPVVVIRGSDRPLLDASDAELGRTGARAWLISWLSGLALQLLGEKVRRDKLGSPG